MTISCPGCKAQVKENQARCYDCGKSLIGISDKNPDLENARPSYVRTPEQEKRTNIIVGILIGLFSLVLVLIVVGAVFIRFLSRVLSADRNAEIEILASTFDIKEMDNDYLDAHGTINKVVITYTVLNKGKKAVSKVFAKILAKSDQLQIWDSKGVNTEFQFINSGNPLGSGEGRTVYAEFPVLYQLHGVATIKWSYEITKVEYLD